ncbi:G-type lectin S-receptor-like serine/threonine-protein kinase LECRK3 [Euphorbia lathyris]|uniref:G-type lectin S-receptor-like serine/threonine-protein kinase LECRK3 n=1 Tax=Euphorbia lathyris TaxID=212925 RepID=UPI0033139FB5
MASILLLFFIFVSTLSTASAQQRHTNISSTIIGIGSSLKPNSINSSWFSPSGFYTLGFFPQGDGFRIGISVAGTVVWTANRDQPPVSGNVTLLFSAESGFILQSGAQGQNIQDVFPDAGVAAASAFLFDSGNFMINNSNGQTIWESFQHPTDTLLPTQQLQAGNQLVSSISESDKSPGIFRLSMQTDGNLVQYPVGVPGVAQYAYYSSNTYGQGDNVTLNLDRDGHVYLLNATGFNIKDIFKSRGTDPIRSMLRIDSDGIFRLYLYNLTHTGNWSVLESSTENKCLPMGICGVNSYCVLNDMEPSCKCLPGFSYVSPQNQSSGCKKDFPTLKSCKGDRGNIVIQQVPNTEWEVNTYSNLQIPLKENCEQACMQDCNCDVAFFGGGRCRLQRLPLRFGRRNMDDGSNLALVKVGRSMSGDEGIQPKRDRKGREISQGILIASGSIVGFGFLVLTLLGMLMHRYHKRAYKRIPYMGLREEVGPQSFRYEELETVTDGFKEKIGRGAFGAVYKGVIPNTQKVVAVKKLEKVLEEGEREFQTEMKVIGKTHHKNLVQLLGYCNEGPNRLLVYEFMSSGSLADVLFSPEKRPCFVERMEIARNIAKGILYLHEECETQIIHCDIKPQNILLDEFRCPKISDFGLAKLLKQEQTKTFTGIRGTRGYLAPEWHRNLPVTVKADIYSFGVMLLEITCCRKNVDYSVGDDESILVECIYDCFVGDGINKLITDIDEVDKKHVDRMIKVGIWCTLDEPSLRPSMKKVVLMLEGTIDIPMPPPPTSFLTSI